MKQGLIESYFLTVTLVVCLFPLITQTAPVSGYDEQWRNPCGSVLSFEPYNLTKENISMVLRGVKTNLHEAETMISFLKNEYRTNRVADEVSNTSCISHFGDNLDNIYFHVNGFPDLSPYFLQRNLVSVCENISMALLHDYEDLVSVMIFLEETIIEEYAQNKGVYGQQLKDLQDFIKGAMCKFHVIEQRCGMKEQNMNATDIIDQYKVSTTSERYRRDYLLIRDMAVLIHSLFARYNACLTLFSTSST